MRRALFEIVAAAVCGSNPTSCSHTDDVSLLQLRAGDEDADVRGLQLRQSSQAFVHFHPTPKKADEDEDAMSYFNIDTYWHPDYTRVECTQHGSQRTFQKALVTRVECYAACLAHPECKYFSHEGEPLQGPQRTDRGMCIGCRDKPMSVSNKAFNSYQMEDTKDAQALELQKGVLTGNYVVLKSAASGKYVQLMDDGGIGSLRGHDGCTAANALTEHQQGLRDQTAMENAGWYFDVQNKWLPTSIPECDDGMNFFGYSGELDSTDPDSVALLTYEFPAEGAATFRVGSCGRDGLTSVYLNGALKGSVPSGQGKLAVDFSFAPGDVVAIRAERGVLQLFGYELVCSRTGEYGAPQETTSEYNCGTLDESWCEEFEDVGVPSSIARSCSIQASEWVCGGLATCVFGSTSMNTACNPHGILCSGRHGHFGNEKAGTRGQQVVDVTEAIKNGGIHPLCPRAGAGAARFLVVAAGSATSGEPLIALWEPSASKFVSLPTAGADGHRVPVKLAGSDSLELARDSDSVAKFLVYRSSVDTSVQFVAYDTSQDAPRVLAVEGDDDTNNTLVVGVTPIGEFEQGFYVEFVGRSHSYLHHLRNGVQIGLYNGFHDRWVSISPVGSLYAEEAKGEKGKLSQAGDGWTKEGKDGRIFEVRESNEGRFKLWSVKLEMYLGVNASGDIEATNLDGAVVFEAHPTTPGKVGIYCRTLERSLSMPNDFVVGLGSGVPKEELSSSPSTSTAFHLVKILPARAGAAAKQSALPALSAFAEREGLAAYYGGGDGDFDLRFGAKAIGENDRVSSANCSAEMQMLSCSHFSPTGDGPGSSIEGDLCVAPPQAGDHGANGSYTEAVARCGRVPNASFTEVTGDPSGSANISTAQCPDGTFLTGCACLSVEVMDSDGNSFYESASCATARVSDSDNRTCIARKRASASNAEVVAQARCAKLPSSPAWSTVEGSSSDTEDLAPSVAACPEGAVVAGCSCSAGDACAGSLISGKTCTAFHPRGDRRRSSSGVRAQAVCIAFTAGKLERFLPGKSWAKDECYTKAPKGDVCDESSEGCAVCYEGGCRCSSGGGFAHERCARCGLEPFGDCAMESERPLCSERGLFWTMILQTSCGISDSCTWESNALTDAEIPALVEVAAGKFGMPSKRSDPADCKKACMESKDCGGFMFAASLAHLAQDTCFFFRDASCGLVEMGGTDTSQADCYFVHESGGTAAAAASEWTLVFRQTVGDYNWPTFRKNAENPGADNYAILDELERFRGQDGKFKFKLQWEGVDDGPQIWKQSSNPTTSEQPVVGYEAVDDACSSAQNWGGLALGDPKNAKIDGTPGYRWWYAIMAGRAFKGGIPACRGPANRTELYVWSGTAAVPKGLGDALAPTALASEEVSEDDGASGEFCMLGVRANNVCCGGDCDGSCGGSGCGGRPGGPERCCWNRIMTDGRICSSPDDVACVVPPDFADDKFRPKQLEFIRKLDQGVDMADEGEVSTGVFVKEILATRYLSLGDNMKLFKSKGADVPDGVGVTNNKMNNDDYPQKEGHAQVVFIVYAHSDTVINLDAEVLYPNGKANSFWVWFDERATKTASHYNSKGYVREFTRRIINHQLDQNKKMKPTNFRVTQGFHTLHFGCREDGTYLRKIWITAGDADFVEGNAAFTLAHDGKICLSKTGGFRYERSEHGCEGECDADGDGPGPCNLQCCRETCATYDWCTHFTWFTNNACRLYDKCDTVVDGDKGATHEKIYMKLMNNVSLVPDGYEVPPLLLE